MKPNETCAAFIQSCPGLVAGEKTTLPMERSRRASRSAAGTTRTIPQYPAGRLSSSFFFLLLSSSPTTDEGARLRALRGKVDGQAEAASRPLLPSDHASGVDESYEDMRRRAKSFTASPPHGELPAATGSGARPRRSARRGRTSARRRQRAAGSSRTSPALRCGTC